jgi:hypothetical protein
MHIHTGPYYVIHIYTYIHYVYISCAYSSEGLSQNLESSAHCQFNNFETYVQKNAVQITYSVLSHCLYTLNIHALVKLISVEYDIIHWY